ncbi:hypothetical protein [Adhaeretor mobilis]|uniref:Uncharacterized protein n=1 Tax=Adhaeretor mobilis TaxID=1930276 RepID=A0A517MS91_9BACT|nr:hypothetical protein [Adhaeretor mobilis]QDS97750.1 hypothetical protein HG15A2_10170 [Adhaeretor mobilis]
MIALLALVVLGVCFASLGLFLVSRFLNADYKERTGMNAFGAVLVLAAIAGVLLMVVFTGWASLVPQSRVAPVIEQTTPLEYSAELAQVYDEAFEDHGYGPVKKLRVHNEIDGTVSTVRFRDQRPARYDSASPEPAYAHGESYSSSSTSRLNVVILAFPLALIVLFALWRHLGKSENEEQHSTPWTAVATTIGLLFLGMMFFWVSASRTVEYATVESAGTSTARGPAVASETTIQELHEQLTEPKIKLEESPQGDNPSIETPPADNPPKVDDPDLVETSVEAKESETTTTSKTQASKETELKPRPAWVSNPPKRVGNVNRRSVSSGPYKTLRECYFGIESGLEEATEERFNQVVQSQAGMSRSHLSIRRYNIGPETILREFCSEEYIERVESPSVGEMKKLHVLMEFGPEQDRYLLNQWRRYERDERIAVVLVTATLVLGTFAFVWGLLWFDTWTRGYYTKWLFVGVPAAIIAGLGVIAFIAESM